MSDIIENIQSALKELKVSTWEISDTTTDQWEFYFIKHRLDQNRAVRTRHTEVTVYRDMGEGMLGSASIEIPQGSFPKEIKENIAGLLEEAAYAVNPQYKLHGPEDQAEYSDEKGKDGISGESGAAENQISIKELAGTLIEAMNDLPETSTEYMNSYEIFARKVSRKYMNSLGLDLEETYPGATMELVVNAQDENREIELYRLPSFGSCSAEELKEYVGQLLEFGKDRLKAEPTPELGKATLLLSTEDACRVYEYFLSQMNAANVYRNLSTWEIGRSIDKEGTFIQPLTIRQMKNLEGSPENHLFDGEGGKVKERVLLEENVPRRYWGSRQYCSYLGIEDGSEVYNYQVEGGTRTSEELREEDYLEVVEFSSFEVDPLTGDIAGEIRLGYWHHQGQTDIVSGGSVSGSLPQLMEGLAVSSEEKRFGTALIPEVTMIHNITVTGIGK